MPDPKILNPRDVIVRITLTAICGSDLHHYDGFLRRPVRPAENVTGTSEVPAALTVS